MMHKVWVMMLAYWGFIKWNFFVFNIPFKFWRKKLLVRCSGPHKPKRPGLFSSKSNSPALDIRTIIDLSEKVARHHPFYVNCLRRCMVQYELLSRYEYPVQLHIGVRFTPAKKLQAHSWLMCNGHLVNDGIEIVSTYTEIADVRKFFAGNRVGMIDK